MTNPKAPERIWLEWNEVSTDFDDDVKCGVYDIFDEPVGRLPMYLRADTVVSKDIVRELVDVLSRLRRDHLYCEDEWYSCPKHPDGCDNEGEGDECNCGADKDNAIIDSAIGKAEDALA